jgi:hypothetical protein
MIIVLKPGRERIRSNPLLARLNEMYKKVADPSDSYCQRPKPRAREVEERLPVDAQLNEDAVDLIEKRKPTLGTCKGGTDLGMTPAALEAMEFE